MTRRCSHCSHNGHNSRTCPNKGVKLFGVRLTDGSIRKSASMGNLTHFMGGGGGGSGSGTPQNGPLHESPADTPDHPSAGSGGVADGYASEDFVTGSSSSSRERKKGVPWTEEEHRMFLLGLQKLGKGDWRGISRNYVITRTPTQVASHAQKYFIRQTNMSRRKRRSSLFDIVADNAESSDAQTAPMDFFSSDPPHKLVTETPAAVEEEEECESMESANSNENEPFSLPHTPEYPQYHPPQPFLYQAVAPLFPMPVPVPVWPAVRPDPQPTTHELVKPLAVHSKSPINVDELVSISNLSLGETLGDSGPSMLSLRLGEGSSRPSAFHASNPSSNGSGVVSSGEASATIGAV